MAEIHIKAKMDELGADLKSITLDTLDRLVGAVARLSEMTYNRIVETASDKLHSTRQQYIDALHLEREGEGVFAVYLDEEADHIETGYPGFGMLPRLAQGPKSKVGKSGKRYTVIPIRKNLGDEAVPSKGDGDMLATIRSVIDERKFKTSKAEVSKTTGKFTTVERYTGSVPSANLKGLTRIREYGGSAKEGKPLSSAYFIFRVASENQDASKRWRHPGYTGLHAFEDTERWANDQVDTILREFFP